MILEKIKKKVLGDFFCYNTVKSTNLEALNCAEAPDKSLFVAKHQTEGRGRNGRSWEDTDGGIFMTILLKPEKPLNSLPALTLATGLAVSRKIENSQIKWPNDIISDGKKVAGILFETRTVGNSIVIAVGIGINANNTEFSEELKEKATSIACVTGRKVEETELIAAVYTEFLRVYEQFSGGFDTIRGEYARKCVTLNREIEVITDNRKRRMFAVGIGDSGELLAEENGKIEAISFGDVSVRGILGYS